MNYKTAAAFRNALETRILNQSRETGLTLVRLRKAVAFDRLLARLVIIKPDRWVLKGGYALQLRLENAHDVRPRTTRDVDLQTIIPRERVREELIRAARIDLGDWVQFDISELAAPREDEQAKALSRTGARGAAAPVCSERSNDCCSAVYRSRVQPSACWDLGL